MYISLNNTSTEFVEKVQNKFISLPENIIMSVIILTRLSCPKL